MNTYLATATTSNFMPEYSGADWLVVLAVVLTIVAISCTWSCVPRGTARVLSVLGAVALGALMLAASITFAVHDTKRSDAEQDRWVAKTQAWAGERYGVEAGLDYFSLHSGRDTILMGDSKCPTQNACYTSDALIGDSIVEVKLVILGDRMMLVGGESETMTELAVVEK